MSSREILVAELERQPDSVARKLLDYLHTLTPPQQPAADEGEKSGGHFSRYWSRFYGAFEDEPWEEPSELPFEKREK